MHRFRVNGTTRTGLVRRSNEDHILLDRSIVNQGGEQLEVPGVEPGRCGVLFAIADGIGGEAGGAIASRLALATLEREYYAASVAEDSRRAAVHALRSAAESANQAVLEAASSEPRLARMGCTLTGVCLLADGYLVFNAGDSRVYRFRQGSLETLTRDDSMASLVVEAGAMTAEEAARSPIGHTLTNCLGSREFQLKVQERAWSDGDLLLACSDGLYDMVSDERIREILSREPVLEKRSESLVEAALAGGGNDNISIVLIAAEGGGEPAAGSD
jgi:PPM family protein phosphatase